MGYQVGIRYGFTGVMEKGRTRISDSASSLEEAKVKYRDWKIKVEKERDRYVEVEWFKMTTELIDNPFNNL